MFTLIEAEISMGSSKSANGMNNTWRAYLILNSKRAFSMSWQLLLMNMARIACLSLCSYRWRRKVLLKPGSNCMPLSWRLIPLTLLIPSSLTALKSFVTKLWTITLNLLSKSTSMKLSEPQLLAMCMFIRIVLLAETMRVPGETSELECGLQPTSKTSMNILPSRLKVLLIKVRSLTSWSWKHFNPLEVCNQI